MNVSLAYGRTVLAAEFPEGRTTVIVPGQQPGLPDEHAAVLAALDHPIGAAPLHRQIDGGTRICLVHTDITRATPNDRIIPWLLAYLERAGAARENILLLNGLGTHRPNTRAELEAMLSSEIVRDYRCLNHQPHDEAAHVQLGFTRGGAPALLNRHLVEADLRIVTGFIEPHFFAGFSGGPKGIMPAAAALRTVQSNHGARQIADSRARFGTTEGNPIWEEMRDIALRVGPSFLLNVTLDERRRITGVFAGDLVAAHRVGCEFVRSSAMQRQPGPYDVVVTSNAGYPLDMNLYQGVKGMRAASLVVRDGGDILLVAECADGIPNGSPFERLLHSVEDPEALLEKVASPDFSWPEQWQSQIQALVQRRAAVHLVSSLSDSAVRAAHLRPWPSIEAFLSARASQEERIAVLPQGPLTVPYLEG